MEKLEHELEFINFKKTVNFILINYNISIFQKIKKNKFIMKKRKNMMKILKEK